MQLSAQRVRLAKQGQMDKTFSNMNIYVIF